MEVETELEPDCAAVAECVVSDGVGVTEALQELVAVTPVDVR